MVFCVSHWVCHWVPLVHCHLLKIRFLRWDPTFWIDWWVMGILAQIQKWSQPDIMFGLTKIWGGFRSKNCGFWQSKRVSIYFRLWPQLSRPSPCLGFRGCERKAPRTQPELVPGRQHDWGSSSIMATPKRIDKQHPTEIAVIWCVFLLFLGGC